MRVELAWGRLRRAWLRRVRPGYVRQMADRRQGTCTCPDGPHDAIDSRDLKFFRNVCGLSFRPVDEASRWRGRLPLARYGLAEVVLFSLVFLGTGLALAHLAYWTHPLFYLPLAVVLAFWVFVISFFRDPHRTIPTGADLVVSPADGTITHVEEVDEPDFSSGRALRVSIFLSVFNVHVNRVPRTGRVTAVRYYPGCFLDARQVECSVRNEQLWVDFEDAGTGRPLRVKQIAGAIARRIVCWLRPGEEVRAGDRYGMIKFGSRTDLLVPADAVAEIAVKIGSKVRGGSTVLLRLTSR